MTCTIVAPDRVTNEEKKESGWWVMEFGEVI